MNPTTELICHLIGIAASLYCLWLIVIELIVPRWIKYRKKHPKPEVSQEPNRRTTVSMDSLGAYSAPCYEYEGLDFDLEHFPFALSKYIKFNGKENLTRYMLQVNSGNMTNKDRLDLCRAVTIAAAFNNTTIPYQLALVDERTQALTHALMKDLLEEEVTKVVLYTLEANTVAKTDHRFNHLLFNSFKLSQLEQHKAILKEYTPHLQTVGEAVMEYYLHDNFPTLYNFAIRCKGTKLSTEDIQSVATAYAGITGIKIPRSYVSYDALSIVLMNPKILPEAEPRTLSLVR